MSEKFWGIQDQIPEPKRDFRWVMHSNLGPSWVIKAVKKPTWAMSVTEIKYINHTFKYPGRITFEPIDITLIDPLNPDASQTTMAILGMSGYRFPTTDLAASHTITKENAVNALGQLSIQQIGLDSQDVVEEWRLVNAWVSAVDPGQLDYDSEETVKVKVTIQYDWGEMYSIGGKASVFAAATNAAQGNADMTEGLDSITKIVGQSQG